MKGKYVIAIALHLKSSLPQHEECQIWKISNFMDQYSMKTDKIKLVLNKLFQIWHSCNYKTCYIQQNRWESARKKVHVIYNFKTKEFTLIVIISSEITTKQLLSVSNIRLQSWCPYTCRWLKGGNICDVMAENTGQGCLSMGGTNPMRYMPHWWKGPYTQAMQLNLNCS